MCQPQILSVEIVTVLLVNIIAYNFQPLPRLFCVWHWSSMSVTMSVYLSNHTKWPPITCPIDLSWRWSLVDNSFYHITVVLSSARKWKGPSELCGWCEINQPIAVGCLNITVRSGRMMTVKGHHRTYRVMYSWEHMVINSWNIYEYYFISVGTLFTFTCLIWILHCLNTSNSIEVMQYKCKSTKNNIEYIMYSIIYRTSLSE